MSVTAKLNNLRIAPRKVRLVADLIRRKSAEEAQTILRFAVKRGSPIILKLLRQAIANAKNNFQLEEADLYILKLTVDEGPKLKRWRARARGSAAPIQKKTCHITLILDSNKPISKVGKGQELKKEKIAEKLEAKEIKTTDNKIRKPRFKTEKNKTEVLKQTQGKDTKRIFRRKAF